jgi:ferredoxin
MPVREVIEIDEELCDGCGDCITACAEGALALIDGKAKLISDVYCDGFGACLGECPQGAISIIHREAEEFDQTAVDRHLSSQGGIPLPSHKPASDLPMAGHQGQGSSCPGAQSRTWKTAGETTPSVPSSTESRLRQWPIQLHLIPPTAPFFKDADVLLAADCVAYAVGGFHSNYLNGHQLAIACPKLDSHQEIYVEKLATMIDEAEMQSLEVMVMEVPCCSGLVRLVQQAAAQAKREIPVRYRVIGVQGDMLADQTL